jgi:hypothetical protein
LARLVDQLDASAVVEVGPMPGGSTAALHRVTVIDRDDDERRVVLRRYIRSEILAESPDAATVKARALHERSTVLCAHGSPRRIYSIRRPDIARAITSCWISRVPSKIVWIIPARPARVAPWCAVH